MSKQIPLYTAILHFEHGEFVDELFISGQSIDELRETAQIEYKRRHPETMWSSDVRKNGRLIKD